MVSAVSERLVWRYEVKSDAVKAFEAAYGPGGDWDQFFAGAPGYIRTEFYREFSAPNVYVTIDYWRENGQRDGFVRSHQAAFDALDARCAAMTIDEQRI